MSWFEDLFINEAKPALNRYSGSGGGGDEVLNSVIDRSVTNIKLNDATSIGQYAFYKCLNLATVECPNVETIADYGFGGNTNLTSVKANSLTSIGAQGFDGCTSLASFNAPKLATTKGNVFKNCKSLTSVSFQNLTELGYAAFHGCTSLVSVSLPTLEVVGSGDNFRECSALTHVDFPRACTVGATMFFKCTSLEEVAFPSLGITDKTYPYASAKLIGVVQGGAFSGCTKLKKVDLATLKGTLSNAFGNCTSLESIIIRRSDAIAPLNVTDAFTGSSVEAGTCFIYVPSALLDAYKSATNWSVYANQFRAIEDYPEICGGASA